MWFAGQLTRPESLVLLLWAVQLVKQTRPSDLIEQAGALVAMLYLLRVSVHLRRPTLILCGSLTALAALLILFHGGLPSVLVGFRSAPMFAGFFGAIVLLRATADQLRQVVNARALFERLEPDHRLGGFLVGSHLLGVVLGPGAYAITAPIIGESKVREEYLAAIRACHRGGSLGGLWSPFWIAMALASQYVPGVPLWRIMVLGMSLGAGALAASHFMYSQDAGMARLWRALRSLQPIVPPVALCVMVVAVLSGVTELSTQEALVLSVPTLCFLTLVGRGWPALRTTLGKTYRGTAHIGNEIAILTVSLALGGVIRHVFMATGFIDWSRAFDLPSITVIGLMIGVTTLGALVGVHQIVSVTFLLTVFTELSTQVADVVLMESVLVAWACSSMIGLSAIMVATATALFRVPVASVILGPNLRFAALFAVGSTLALTGVNAWLT